MNRILEIECGERVFEDPQETAELVKHNYGFAGKEFVKIIKELGNEVIRHTQSEFQKKLFDDEKMQKQSISLSIILTADKIATEHLFKDGQYISLDEAKEVLIDRNELSDNERCYQYILSDIAINSAKFDPATMTNEKWGVIEDGYAIIYNNIFDQLCKKGGFSKKAFLSWADKRGVIITQGGKTTKVKKFDGNPKRCVFLKLDDSTDKDGFIEVDDEQMELPFK